jgi:iron complex transport system substrate-binding protein
MIRELEHPRRFEITTRRLLLVFSVLLVLGAMSPALARDIVDMTGRKVSVPDRVHRVFFRITSRHVPGLRHRSRCHNRSELPSVREREEIHAKGYQSLPSSGGMVGQGRNINQEVLLAFRPDVIVIWSGPHPAVTKTYEQIFAR